MPRKKKELFVDGHGDVQEVIKEVSKLIAEETLQATDLPKKKKPKEVWPKVIIGSHSTRTEYEDGRVDFVTDWDALQRDVREAISNYEASQKKLKSKK